MCPPSTCSMARDGVGSASRDVMLFSLPPSCTCHGASLPLPPPASSSRWCGPPQSGQHLQSTCVLAGGVDLSLFLIQRREQSVSGQDFVHCLVGTISDLVSFTVTPEVGNAPTSLQSSPSAQEVLGASGFPGG